MNKSKSEIYNYPLSVIKNKRGSAGSKIFGGITLILLLVVAGILGFLFYDVYTGKENIVLQVHEPKEDVNSPIFNNTISDDYPGGMLFYPSMRFASRNISYSIDESCPDNRSDNARRGFEILGEETVLSFYEVDDGGEILVSCSEDIEYVDEEHFVAGEGGPNSIVNMSNRILIQNGTILLYEDSDCSRPIVAIHEILHVIGFQHSSSKESIMYNYSDCNQKITSNIVDKIAELYKDETLPDLMFRNVSGVKHGRYLDMEFLITNSGLEKSDKTEVKIIYNEEKVATTYDIKELEIGEGKIVSFQNVKIGYSTDEISLLVDNSNKIKEINEDNNIVVLTLSE